MRKLKKVVSLTVVTAILAAAMDMGSVEAAQNFAMENGEAVIQEVTQSEPNQGAEDDFQIEDGVLVKYLGAGGDVVVPDGVTEIGDYAFYGCSSLSSIEIPGSVMEIGDYAFSGCSSLSSIKLPDSVRSIGDYAFSGCSSLSSIEIPGSVTSIGDCAFSGCSSLSSIEIPGSVTSIGYSAFSGCDKLTILCEKGSDAEVYAKIYNIPYKYIGDMGEPMPSAEPTQGEAKPSAEPTQEAKPSAAPTQTLQKVQTIKANNFTKVYGTKSFTIGAKTDGNGKLSYTSGNKKVAVVSERGKVTITGCGKTTITIKASETKEYKAAEKKITITVKPKQQKISSVKSTSSKTFTVKWKKDTKATGYILQYATDKKFEKNVKNVVIANNKTTSKKVSKLKAGKKYYVRICSYKTFSKTKIRGSYSAVKSVTTKK